MTRAIDAKKIVSAILTEDVLTLSQGRNEIHKATGNRPDKATMCRWIHRGVGGIRLEAICIGNRMLTSRQAITRFIEARTAKTLGN